MTEWTPPTNAQRARWGELALFLHANLTGGQDNDPEDQITDLVADLIHFCDTKEIFFDEIYPRADVHYNHELMEETSD